MKRPVALGEFEQVVLLAILRLGDEAYGVTIREEIGLVHGLGPVAVLNINGAIFLYPRGFGADVLDFEATVIDPAREAIVSVGVGGAHRAPVQRKLAKVLDWYRTEIKLRDNSSSPLLTVFELWTDGRPLRRAS